MGILSKLFNVGDIATPIDAIGNAFDKLFTSDEEKMQAQAVMEKLRQHPAELQVEINKIEAAHRSVFVAGWRPFIGWVAGVSLGLYFIPQYIIASYLWAIISLEKQALQEYPVAADGLLELVLAMLGMAGLRTFDKLTGKSK